MKKNNKIFITGGGGYVGCALADYLANKGYEVTTYDIFIYGKNVFENENVRSIIGDIRDVELFKNSIKEQDIVVHLACISNDPSFELNPQLGKSINFDSFEPMVKICKKEKIKRFIYASSSSVYGIKEEKNVHEDMSLEPITDYSKFKADCEKILTKYKDNEFETVTVRPATVCGYSKRQRLDLVVNILANIGFHNRTLSVFGGKQLRPNIHIKDMVRAYELLIEAPGNLVNGEIFNAGWENKSIEDIALTVKSALGEDLKIITTSTDDTRSYHISSEKIKRVLNFDTKFTIFDAITDLKEVFNKKILENPLENENYFNIKKMQSIELK